MNCLLEFELDEVSIEVCIDLSYVGKVSTGSNKGREVYRVLPSVESLAIFPIMRLLLPIPCRVCLNDGQYLWGVLSKDETAGVSFIRDLVYNPKDEPFSPC